MNFLQISLLILAAIFFLLLPISRKAAIRYARVTILFLVATLMLMPFAWLICAAFTDKSVLNEFTFLPPISQISAKTINLTNFRELLAPQPTAQGPVIFWRYVINSLFLASTM